MKNHFIPVVMLTAVEDRETKLRALDLGATDFLRKPVDPSELVPRVRNALVVKARDATTIGPAGRNNSFGLVFCDPPYGQGLGEKGIAAAADGGWLADGAVVVLEERDGVEVAMPAGVEIFDTRSWGKTQMLFARYRGAAAGSKSAA